MPFEYICNVVKGEWREAVTCLMCVHTVGVSVFFFVFVLFYFSMFMPMFMFSFVLMRNGDVVMLFLLCLCAYVLPIREEESYDELLFFLLFFCSNFPHICGM